jgi:hypothetical protein
MKGSAIGVLPERPVGPQACTLLSVARWNHAAAQQSTKGPQLRVDTTTVSLAIPVDVLPLSITKWTNHHPVLLALSRWSLERVSQPTKIELVTSFKNESK